MEKALPWAHDHHVTTVVDVNWRPAFWPDPSLVPDLIKSFLNQVDMVKFAQYEADWLLQSI